MVFDDDLGRRGFRKGGGLDGEWMGLGSEDVGGSVDEILREGHTDFQTETCRSTRSAVLSGW